MDRRLSLPLLGPLGVRVDHDASAVRGSNISNTSRLSDARLDISHPLLRYRLRAECDCVRLRLCTILRLAQTRPHSDPRNLAHIYEACTHFPTLRVRTCRAPDSTSVTTTVNDKVYIHEFIDIIGHNRANYMHHMTANWCPMAQEERNQLCFGVWGIVGSTRGWPEVVNMWEERASTASRPRSASSSVTRRCRTRSSPSGGPRRRATAVTASTACSCRRRGPARSASCRRRRARRGLRPRAIHVPLGTARDFLEIVAEEAIPVYEEFGWMLFGAFVTSMVNESECFLHWAIPTWESWAENLHAERKDSALQRWRRAPTSSARSGTASSWSMPAVADAHRPPARPLRPRRELGRPLKPVQRNFQIAPSTLPRRRRARGR